MLRNLSIRDFVIVDQLEIEFEGGFTVFSGETGAGKSILIDAVALIQAGGFPQVDDQVAAGVGQAVLVDEVVLHVVVGRHDHDRTRRLGGARPHFLRLYFFLRICRYQIESSH